MSKYNFGDMVEVLYKREWTVAVLIAERNDLGEYEVILRDLGYTIWPTDENIRSYTLWHYDMPKSVGRRWYIVRYYDSLMLAVWDSISCLWSDAKDIQLDFDHIAGWCQLPEWIEPPELELELEKKY